MSKILLKPLRNILYLLFPDSKCQLQNMRGAASQWSNSEITCVKVLSKTRSLELLFFCCCWHRKLFLYSVHDTTLMPCLMALGVFDMKWPPYAADITLELYQHRQTNQHYVKVSYIGQVRPFTQYSGGKMLQIHTISFKSLRLKDLCSSRLYLFD